MATIGCPYCGNPIVSGQTICDICGQPIRIATTTLKQQVGMNTNVHSQTSAYAQPQSNVPVYTEQSRLQTPVAPQQDYTGTQQRGFAPRRGMGTPQQQRPRVPDTSNPYTAERTNPTQPYAPPPFDAELDLPMYNDLTPRRDSFLEEESLQKPIGPFKMAMMFVISALILIGGTIFFLNVLTLSN